MYPNSFRRERNEPYNVRENSIYYQWKTEYGNTPVLEQKDDPNYDYRLPFKDN